MSAAYTGLAGWFEYLNQDCDYEKWSQYLHKRLKEAGTAPGGRGLDIGCGSGYFTRYFQNSGYDMTGFDVSPEMLAQAEARKGGAAKPQYVLADVRKLKINGRADFAVAVNDCFNYVPPKDIPAALRRVAAAVKKGGAFLFDVSSEYKLREIVGNNTFCEDREEVAYMWFNRLYPDRVEMDVTVFSRRGDGLFSRADEHHVQYIHSEAFLREELEKAGFLCLKTEGALGNAEDRTRVNFIAKRV